MKRLILAASFVLAVAVFAPAGAMADSPICHDGILSNDAGQGCTNDAAYGGAPASSGGWSDGAICHDGILSDDAGHNCADGMYERVYGSGGSSSSSTSVSAAPAVVSSSSSSGYADVPGVPSAFAACVALRESSNGAGSSNIYGIEGAGGQGSLAAQKQAFAQMYGARGTEPWAPYDGC